MKRMKCKHVLLMLLLTAFLATACAAEQKEPLITAGGGRTAAHDTSGNTDTTSEPEEKPSETDSMSLREFCDDPEVDAFFDNLADNQPVKLDYWVFGEAPYKMEFTDPALIQKTAAALQTVRIGAESDENPDNVADAGGDGFTFWWEDGSSIGFSFMMGTFAWNGSAYHHVDGYGDLAEMKQILHDEGFHTYDYVYAEDDGFYTEYYDLYETGWEDEDALFGGIRIYTEAEGEAPFVSIRRILGESGDPAVWLENTFPALLEQEAESAGGAVTSAGNVETGDHKSDGTGSVLLAHVVSSFTDAAGTVSRADVYVGEYEDDLVNETVLVQFAAVYEADAEEQADACLEALSYAIRRFYLDAYTRYDSGEVQPGELLFDFCNDARMNEWVETALENPPRDLFIRLPDEDIDITDDPDTVLRVLKALATVRIGDKATETVGASDPRYFMFIDPDTGEGMDIMFNKDQFNFGVNNYKVTDWGELRTVLDSLSQ